MGGDDAERAVARLHAGLSAGQRAAICWPWNHADREEFLPPRFAARHGQVGRPGVAGNAFTPAQQALIRHIVRALLASFRAADRASALRCLAAQGGAERLHIAVRVIAGVEKLRKQELLF